MSRIYFHAKHREVELYGSERAYISCMANDLAMAIIRLDAYHDIAWARTLVHNPPAYIKASLLDDRPSDNLPIHHYLEWSRWAQTLKTWLNVEGSVTVGDDQDMAFGDIAHNTLVVTGSPQMQLMAHISGTCEIHGRFEADDCTWLAETIEAGRETNLMRPGQGWEAVAELACEVAKDPSLGPIVMSYSVCDSFPGHRVLDVSYEDWEQYPVQDRWELCVVQLERNDWPFAIGPQTRGQLYSWGHSAFDLAALKRASSASA